MGVVYAEDSHALANPKEYHALEFLPQLLPILCLEVKGIDILIFFRRILRILHTSIRALFEPAWMLFHIRVIGCTLEGQIYGDFDAALPRTINQLPKFIKSA